MLFDIMNSILCGVKKTRVHGANTMATVGINCLGRLARTDVLVVSVNGSRYAPVF